MRIAPKNFSLDLMERDAIGRALELLARADERSAELLRARIARKGHAPKWAADLETLETRIARVADLREQFAPE